MKTNNLHVSTPDVTVSYFVKHDTGLLGVTLKTPKGDLRFTGCWDGDNWHPNSKPIWTFSSRNSNGSYNIEDLEAPNIPRPRKPTERSFVAAVRAWFKKNPT